MKIQSDTAHISGPWLIAEITSSLLLKQTEAEEAAGGSPHLSSMISTMGETHTSYRSPCVLTLLLFVARTN